MLDSKHLDHRWTRREMKYEINPHIRIHTYVQVFLTVGPLPRRIISNEKEIRWKIRVYKEGRRRSIENYTRSMNIRFDEKFEDIHRLQRSLSNEHSRNFIIALSSASQIHYTYICHWSSTIPVKTYHDAF